MQNKPNLLDAQMNVSSILTTDYENKSNWTLGENKPNSNPIKANFQKAQMNANSLITTDYRKYDDFAVQKNKPNSNPIKPNSRQEMPKMPYLSACVKRHYAGTVKAIKANRGPRGLPFIVSRLLGR